jgi:poly(3-hydroxybutyrate) depolymerase
VDTSEGPHLDRTVLQDETRVSGTAEVVRVHQGVLDRHARIYRPATPSRRPGLVILLHGAVGSGEQMARLTNFDAQADRLGWIAAYPDAHNPGPLAVGMPMRVAPKQG